MISALYNTLSTYIKEDIYPFHMPAHKRNKDFLDHLTPYMDITEIAGMDNLHNPTGIIKNTQCNLSLVFGAKESFLLVNGSSGGIIAAIMTVCKDGDFILAARNSHSSFFSGLVYSGANPIYVMPEMTQHGFAGGISPHKIEAELKRNKKIKAVYITSPTYEGIVSDIKEIAVITHKYDKLLIVDEAHGGHFVFSKFFPKTSLELGADIVIQSLHKTLPVFTQSAVLHTSHQHISLLSDNLRFVQTSSPSYMFMATVDKCIVDLINNEKWFDDYISLIQNFRNNCESLTSIKLMNKDIVGKLCISDIDLGKLVFLTKNITGVQLETMLYNHKIQIEMSSIYHAIAMTSVADTKEGFERLLHALKKIDAMNATKDKVMECNVYPVTTPEIIVSPRKAFYMQKIKVRIEESIGFASAETISLYPPGIPVIVMGELITEEIIKCIKLYKQQQMQVVGINSGDMDFIEILQ